MPSGRALTVQIADQMLAFLFGWRSRSITFGRTTLVPLQAQSLRSQALCLFLKRINFLIRSGALSFRRICAAQLFQRFLNGEFGCFSHGMPSYLSDERSDNRNQQAGAGYGLSIGQVLESGCFQRVFPRASAIRG